ncbi:hypothetical protein BKA70DRAFT_70246 [Coprinopsis sp. MPI-PUGE-AT-0042]|nr:hypothetical protein BKA70DRAFT_70246 [Coprinopsis sp. MPI-PUGE-AT-0042]
MSVSVFHSPLTLLVIVCDYSTSSAPSLPVCWRTNDDTSRSQVRPDAEVVVGDLSNKWRSILGKTLVLKEIRMVIRSVFSCCLVFRVLCFSPFPILFLLSLSFLSCTHHY